MNKKLLILIGSSVSGSALGGASTYAIITNEKAHDYLTKTAYGFLLIPITLAFTAVYTPLIYFTLDFLINCLKKTDSSDNDNSPIGNTP